MFKPLMETPKFLPSTVQITIYKAFIQPYFDYGYVMYNLAFNDSFKEKNETYSI